MIKKISITGIITIFFLLCLEMYLGCAGSSQNEVESVIKVEANSSTSKSIDVKALKRSASSVSSIASIKEEVYRNVQAQSAVSVVNESSHSISTATPSSTPLVGEQVITDAGDAAVSPTVTPTASISPTPTPVIEEPSIEKESVITGSMRINFGTRINQENSQEDSYNIKLDTVDGFTFSGDVKRKPFVSGGVIRKEESEKINYAIKITYKDKVDSITTRSIGKITGAINIGKDGIYRFGESFSNELRMEGTYPRAFQGNFAGKILGKKQKGSESLLAKVTRYTRIFEGKRLTIEKGNLDPLSFQELVLPAGPLESYPVTKVNGNLDYDYETGNWLTNGITFEYNLGGRLRRDLVTGSIKWTEDPNRNQNGKGYYDFNLRFNEDGVARDEGAAFEELAAADEEAFFIVDTETPALTGRVNYLDTISQAGEESTVTSSVVDYNLSSHLLTNIQVMNFLKLWLVIIGPVNDE